MPVRWDEDVAAGAAVRARCVRAVGNPNANRDGIEFILRTMFRISC